MSDYDAQFLTGVASNVIEEVIAAYAYSHFYNTGFAYTVSPDEEVRVLELLSTVKLSWEDDE